MKVNKVDHICIAVKDLDKARNVWEPILGKSGPNDHYIDEPEKIRVARYWVGEVGFELMESTTPDGKEGVDESGGFRRSDDHSPTDGKIVDSAVAQENYLTISLSLLLRGNHAESRCDTYDWGARSVAFRGIRSGDARSW
jgi:catechol 2,3-dioxygenase-like lactoylglutathione lyase family enzyme